MTYVRDLNDLKAKESHLPKEIGDQWRTPDWLFYAVDKLYGPLVVDLFTDGQNSKCAHYFTAEDNALQQNWKDKLIEAHLDLLGVDERISNSYYANGKCFANPPYSIKKSSDGEFITGMTHILKKAHDEHLKGVPSVWVVKSATSETWWPNETASQIIHIKGRIGFEPPVWYAPDLVASKVSGAGFGASIVIFSGNAEKEPDSYIARDKLMEIGLPLAELNADKRREWVNKWDDI